MGLGCAAALCEAHAVRESETSCEATSWCLPSCLVEEHRGGVRESKERVVCENDAQAQAASVDARLQGHGGERLQQRGGTALR